MVVVEVVVVVGGGEEGAEPEEEEVAERNRIYCDLSLCPLCVCVCAFVCYYSHLLVYFVMQ